MNNSRKIVDFSEMSLFVGIDVHKKSWKVTVRTADRFLQTFSTTPDPQALLAHLTNNYPGATVECVYEAGFCGFWPQRAFALAGVNCLVVHAPDIPSTDKDRRRKTDPYDSRRLADLLAAGILQGISVPSLSQDHDRALLRSRAQFIRDRTRVKNRIKSLLNYFGYKPPSEKWNKPMLHWLESKELPESVRFTLDQHIEDLHHLNHRIKKLDAKIKELSETELYRKQTALLTGIPSIGTLTAMVLLTEVGRVDRFASRSKFMAFLGLIPNTYSSGESERIGRITKRANGQLRWILIEASWVAIRKDPALTLKFERLCKRMKKNQAIIRIARSLANRIRYVLKEQQPYVLGVFA